MRVIGCGTGRCGTMTLAKLLNTSGLPCTHEQRPMLPWLYDDRIYRVKLRQLLSQPRRADVCYSYLPSLPNLFKDIPDLKVVCLRRPAEQVAESFEAWIDSMPVPHRHHWYDHKGVGWVRDPSDHTFPKYDIPDRYASILHYVHEYDAGVDKLMRERPDATMLVHTAELGEMGAQKRIYDFCEIPLHEQIYQPGAVYNQRPNSIWELPLRSMAGKFIRDFFPER